MCVAHVFGRRGGCFECTVCVCLRPPCADDGVWYGQIEFTIRMLYILIGLSREVISRIHAKAIKNKYFMLHLKSKHTSGI